ncbi:hypothetical protein SNOG_20107 [Parastagonospora nodorum SN15]|uniref:Uncharacterized protein n=1 Tax=Phaeosphaeria nodorum (strain SN15 / ATCC MYA-4574 / FGSC 10173) TaxID=321614 RepID=A9JXA3_PHANO|nr:hypothetical protein SNOG_20107 [Parastagonospora nodorum SN15]EDP89795.1 hypothetical protein SNOG_20107 [Parastagonospora nodorum SN15]
MDATVNLTSSKSISTNINVKSINRTDPTRPSHHQPSFDFPSTNAGNTTQQRDKSRQAIKAAQHDGMQEGFLRDGRQAPEG